MLNLHTHTPESRVDDSTPQALTEAAEALSNWDEHACTVIDYLLNAWTLRACMNDDPEGLADLETALNILLNQLPQSGTLEQRWRHRWQAFQAILCERALRFTTDREIADLLQRKHITDLLHHLATAQQGEVSQTELRTPLDLSQSRASQLLGQIADHGLVQHRKLGKEKAWSLTQKGREVATLPPISSIAPPTPASPITPTRRTRPNPNAGATLLLFGAH
jgi:predicted transcriptional regulator